MEKIGGSVNLKKIAVTGSLAGGKTTVCALLRELGPAYVVDADQLVHQLLSPETDVGRRILKAFGPRVLVNGRFDRREIAREAFADRDKLAFLEETLHPLIAKEINREFQKAKLERVCPFFVAEVPLLFESKTPYEFDCIVAVIADPKICQERFLERTQGDSATFTNRFARQLPAEQKASLSHYTIVNNGSLADLRRQVETLINNLEQLK